MSVLSRYLAIVFVVGAVAVCSAQSVQVTPLPKDGRAFRRVVPEFAVFELVVDLGEPPF